MHKKTKRERQMLLNKKRLRHELRKRRKRFQSEPLEGYPANILAMFKPKKRR